MTGRTSLQDALLLHWERHYSEAEANYRAALGQDPRMVPARLCYALLLTQRGQAESAEGQLAAVLAEDQSAVLAVLTAVNQLDPFDGAVLGLLGLIALKEADVDTARLYLQQARSLSLDNACYATWAVLCDAGQRPANGADGSPPSSPKHPDETVQQLAQTALDSWRAGDTTRCLTAAKTAHDLADETTKAQALALQCGLIWIALSWTRTPPLSREKRQALQQLAAAIERRDQPLRGDFMGHLLAHLAHATVIGERYPLTNLALNLTDPESRRLVQLIEVYPRLDQVTRQSTLTALKDRATGPVGPLLAEACRQLLESTPADPPLEVE